MRANIWSQQENSIYVYNTHMSQTADTPHPTLGLAVKRGLLRKCPHCGEGKLFASYLKQVESCDRCGESYGQIRSDDAAPWLTILVVGHIIGPLMLSVSQHTSWPFWFAMCFWPSLTLVLGALVLPLAKGVFISAIWVTRAPNNA